MSFYLELPAASERSFWPEEWAAGNLSESHCFKINLNNYNIKFKLSKRIFIFINIYKLYAYPKHLMACDSARAIA